MASSLQVKEKHDHTRSHLDDLYEEIAYLDYNQVDKLVQHYQQSKDPSDKAGFRSHLLQSYHKYFLKYVYLLKGHSATMNKDTILFLSLFSKGRSSSSALHGTYKTITKLCVELTEEDIYNELVIIFLNLLEKYQCRPQVSFSAYIIKYMRWSIKDWLLKNNPVLEGVEYLDQVKQQVVEPKQDDSSRLSLQWVYKPQDIASEKLTTYERFLLYLTYKEGLSSRQIALKLGKTKNSVCIHIQKAMNKLKEEIETSGTRTFLL